MKKIYYIFAALLLSMTLSSCGEKWLNVESHDKIPVEVSSQGLVEIHDLPVADVEVEFEEAKQLLALTATAAAMP